MSDRYTQALGRLYERIPRGRTFGLERIAQACAKFGNPERRFPAVHVGGTNGKGSVCAFVDSMLRADGSKVGLYTSPHLNLFTERVRINGECLDKEVTADLLEEVLSASEDLSFFEATTLLGFLAFERADVDWAVLEVGLGGRLDATNVIPPPAVAAISRVSFDHMDVLGNTLTDIAREKAAIIKAGSRVVTGKLHPDAARVVEARCEEVNARRIPLGGAEPYPGVRLAYPRLAMYGTNLHVACTIARELRVSTEAIAEGVENTVWPGRNELLHRGGKELTLLDCAHNPDGAVCLSQVIAASLDAVRGARRNVALVFGSVAGKNWKSMLDRLDQCVGHRMYVRPPVSHSVAPEPMAEYRPGHVCQQVPEALEAARAAVGREGLVVVAGSIFLVGAARASLLDLETDPLVEA